MEGPWIAKIVTDKAALGVKEKDRTGEEVWWTGSLTGQV